MSSSDYCNCEHAQMLREALVEAQELLKRGLYGSPQTALAIIVEALAEDERMRREYLNK